jgi:thiol-disulfide isomerase/thioredoxin
MTSRSLVRVRRRSRAATTFALIVIVLMLLSACSEPGGKKLEKATDFRIGSYTTANVLPDGESSFSQVLALKKPIVLNFWGGDCPPCRQEMPDFQKVADQYQSQVIFVGIDVGPFVDLGTHDQAKQLLKDLDITYPTGYSIDDTPVRAYNLPGLPMTLLIDKEGRIEKTKPGLYSESDLKSDIKKLVTD